MLAIIPFMVDAAYERVEFSRDGRNSEGHGAHADSGQNGFASYVVLRCNEG